MTSMATALAAGYFSPFEVICQPYLHFHHAIVCQPLHAGSCNINFEKFYECRHSYMQRAVLTEKINHAMSQY